MSETDKLCASAAEIINREFTQRPGQAGATAPNGKLYRTFETPNMASPVDAVEALGAMLRSFVVQSQGDTVWWRLKPMVEQDENTKQWRARARLQIGFKDDESKKFMPNDAEPAAYPGDGQAALPRWKCHKQVRAAKITGFQFPPAGPVACMGDVGSSALLAPAVFARMIGMTKPDPEDGEPWANLVGGYYIRYADGYESWSPAKAFEDGYTRMG